MNLIRLKLYIFTVMVFIVPSAFSKVVSNQIPRITVDELLKEGLWRADWDDNPQGYESQQILTLLEKLKFNTDVNGAVDLLIDSHFGIEPNQLYPVKVAIIRGLLSHPAEAISLGYSVKQLQKVEVAWVTRYLDTAIAVIQQSGVPEYNEILTSLKDSLHTGKLKVVDLSPVNREQLAQTVGLAHGSSLTEKSEGAYLVQGAYFEESQKLAGDFSRPIGEILVTLAHEIVHAADPEIQRARHQFQSLGPSIKSMLVGSLGDKVGESLISDVIDQVFYDIGKPELVGTFNSSDKSQSSSAKWAGTGKQPSAVDEQLLRTWMQSLIAHTVKNEFKAYTLSILVYQGLKSANIILPSGQRERLARIIADGDGRFLRQLGLRMSPFMRSMRNYNKLVDKVPIDQRPEIDYWIHYLEGLYLSELEGAIRSASQDISRRVRPMNIETVSHQTSDWTKPGGFDSVTNPYTLITARVSTLSSMRMKQGILSATDRLKELGNSLITLRAGVLDLHAISIEELRMLQIVGPENSEGNSYGHLNCSPQFSKKTPSVSEKYFQMSAWSSNMLLGENAISSRNLLDSLLKLRLLQSFGWLKSSFPDLKGHMIGAKVLLSKLREGLYDQEDLSAQRAKDLEAELIEALDGVQLTTYEMGQVSYLTQFLLTAHQIVVDRKWSDLSGEMESLQSNVLRALDNMGVTITTFDKEKFEDHWSDLLSGFYSIVEKIEDVCDEVKPMISVVKDTQVSINGQSFPIKFVCQNKRAFLVRTPCDQPWVSSKLENGKPLIRLFNGSRMIEVIPYVELHR